MTPTGPYSKKYGVAMVTNHCLAYLKEAVDSVLTQSFSDFQFLIVDDGSNSICCRYMDDIKDPRVRIIHKSGLGVSKARNIALQELKTEYIFIADADDISEPDRLQTQINHLEKNPDICLLGGFTFPFNENKNKALVDMKLPLTHEAISRRMLSTNCVCNPTVVYKRDLAISVGGYRTDYFSCEDYDIFTRLILAGRVQNLDRVLVKYRNHPNQLSRIITQRKKDIVAEIRKNYLIAYEAKFGKGSASIEPLTPSKNQKLEHPGMLRVKEQLTNFALNSLKSKKLLHA